MRQSGIIVDFLFAAFCLALSIQLFIVPGAYLVHDLNDPALRTGAIPQAAWRLHDYLAPRYAQWASQFIASQSAAHLDNSNVADTEWPLFGSVFYLLSLESLQDAWDVDHSLASVAPNVRARDAIEASVNLVLDANSASWVREKYHGAYLQKDDLFYRFLRLSAMTSYTRLTGEPRLLGTLRSEAASLTAELDASPHGLIDDYPGECYPADIVSAIATIARADKLLGINSSAFVARALRGFVPPNVDTGNLPPYMSSPSNGLPEEVTRGVGNSDILIFSPGLWPGQAHAWYIADDQYFWQRRWGLVGFREFSNQAPAAGVPSFSDIDSGPVLLDFGTAASAFGVGAARANGRMDEAAPLTGEMLATSWPIAGGSLLLPWALTRATEAPYLGETAILFCLTRVPVAGVQASARSVMTPFTWGMLLAYFVPGLLLLKPAIRLAWGLRFHKRK